MFLLGKLRHACGLKSGKENEPRKNKSKLFFFFFSPFTFWFVSSRRFEMLFGTKSSLWREARCQKRLPSPSLP